GREFGKYALNLICTIGARKKNMYTNTQMIVSRFTFGWLTDCRSPIRMQIKFILNVTMSKGDCRTNSFMKQNSPLDRKKQKSKYILSILNSIHPRIPNSLTNRKSRGQLLDDDPDIPNLNSLDNAIIQDEAKPYGDDRQYGPIRKNPA